MFFTIQVFEGPGFSGSRARVRVQVLEGAEHNDQGLVGCSDQWLVI